MWARCSDDCCDNFICKPLVADLDGPLMSSDLQIRDLTVGFPGRTLFRAPDMDIPAGTILAVLGANGSGKSSFVKALLGVLSPMSGEVIWPHQKPHPVAYLAQRTEFDQLFPLRVRDLIAMGKWRGTRFWSRRSWAHSDELLDAAERVGLQGVLTEPMQILSGGQLQRALFARVIMQDAPFVVLDEPFTAIDEKTERMLQELILEWREQGRTVVLAIHDLSAVLRHCDAALLLGEGRARFGAPGDVLTAQNLIDQGYLSRDRAAWIVDHQVSLGLQRSA